MKNNIPHPAPRTVIPQDIDIIEAEIHELSNGVKLYTLDCTDQDVIRFSFVFRAGTSLQQVPFSASSTANLLAEGSLLHSSHEIAETLDFYGSYYSVSLDRDYVVITFASLLKFFPQTLETAREILLMPAFSCEEIATYVDKRKQRLAIERSKAQVKARELFISTLFGQDHPYGECYETDLYDNLTREDIVGFYRSRYTASNCFIVSSGKIGDKEKEVLKQFGEDFPQGGDCGLPTFPAVDQRKFAFRTQDNAVQACIRTGTLLFTRTHPDFIPMQVAATILGGYFGSRLVHNLREQRGYTYGAFSSVVNLEHNGYLAISTDVATEAAPDAVHQIFHEVDRLRTETVPAAELDMVRNIMIGEAMRVLDGPFGIADVTIENVQNGSGNRYLERFLEEIRTIDAEKIMHVAQKYLDPAKFTTIVVGDPKLESMIVLP